MEGRNDKEKHNRIEFAADSSIIVSEIAWIANWVFENMLKLCMDMVKTLVEWTDHDSVHKEWLSKLGTFCNVPEDSFNCTKQKAID